MVIPDCDEGDPATGTRKGREAAQMRATLLESVSDDVRIVDLSPDHHDGYDVSDWLNDGHTAEELKCLVDTAPRMSLTRRVTQPTITLPHGLSFNGIGRPMTGNAPVNDEIVWDDAYPWPTLDPAALYGLAGEFVRVVAPHSEADLSALLSQFLCVFGCGIGPSAHVMVEATPHTGRINVLLIGETAGGRKGTAKDQVFRVFRIADEQWLEAAQVSGLASGEGLIARLEDRDEGEPVEKRVVVMEPEFARTLAAGSREGSILGAIIRDAWDSGRLQNLTRKEPLIAKGCHVSIIGHITADELRAKLSSIDLAGGLYNRFNSIVVQRRQRLPHGGALTDADLAPIAKRLRTALDFARQVHLVWRTAAASAAWEAFYNAVPEPKGLLGAATARAEAQVLRMSVLYALLDGSTMIDVPHLRAAEALWNYAHASAEYVFGSTLGDDVADRVLEELQARYPDGADREQLRGIFSRHVKSARLTTAIEYLVRRGLATTERVKTDGRPRESIRALPRAKSAKSAKSHAQPDLSALSALFAQAAERFDGNSRAGQSGEGSVAASDGWDEI